MKLVAAGAVSGVLLGDLYAIAKKRVPQVIRTLRSELGEIAGNEIKLEVAGRVMPPSGEGWSLIEIPTPVLDAMLLKFALPHILVEGANVPQVLLTWILRGRAIVDPYKDAMPGAQSALDEILADSRFTEFVTGEIVTSYWIYTGVGLLAMRPPSQKAEEIARRFGVTGQVLLLSLGAFAWLRGPHSRDYIEACRTYPWDSPDDADAIRPRPRVTDGIIRPRPRE